MRKQDSEGQGITPEQGWTSIHATLDRSHSSMYMAGWTRIMLLWGAIVAAGYLSMYSIETLAPRVCRRLLVVSRSSYGSAW